MDVILAQLSVVSSNAPMDVLNQKAKVVESPKHERRLRTKRSVPSRSTSKTESSGSSSDTPMHECDACDEIKGKLITCDNCFGAFHMECLNPSLSQEELERIQDGEAVCSYCASSVCASKAVSPSNSDILEWGSPKRSPKVSRSADSSPSNTPKSKRKKSLEKVCECCEQSGRLVSCNVCSKTYHSYCLEPPLLEESILWQCPDHEMNVDILPDQTFKLDFQPEEWTVPRVSSLDEHQSMDKTLCDEEKDQTLQLSDSYSQPTDWLLELSQERVYSDHTITISPLMLDNLSPSFVKFLAWQRLSQMYKEWHHKQPISKTPSS